jgi:hypothetical protein
MRAPRRENRGRGRGLTRDWPAIPSVVAGVIRNSFSEPKDVRRRLLDNLWIELRRFGAPNVRNIELSGIRDIQSVRVEGPVIRHSALIVSALSTLLECERIFDIGTSEGETSWLLAHNHPKARIYTFDAESSAPTAGRRRFHETIEASRITELRGDSATFDFSPYSGVIDLVHIDASHRKGSIRSDTDAAFSLLSELGSIVWYGYTNSPGAYVFLNELAPSLDRPIYHFLGTRLALYSRWDIVLDDA